MSEPFIIDAPTMTAAVTTAGTPANDDAEAPPEVRQCRNPDDLMYGAVAVAGTENAAGLWGVMHPSRGGHWLDPEGVADWDVL